MQYLGPYVRRALQPLVQAGYLEVVYGGGAVGQHLCNHPGVDSGAHASTVGGRAGLRSAPVARWAGIGSHAAEHTADECRRFPLIGAAVHLTGSAQTHDAIVWQGKPKTGGPPPFKKPVRAELGCAAGCMGCRGVAACSGGL